MLLSVIIPCRNEFPNVVHTVHSIFNCLEADGFALDDYEIILVDNGSTDTEHDKPGTKGTSSYLMARGCYYSGKVRVLYDPICGNHSARNKGVEIAQGEYVFFSDAHMSYRPGFFKKMLSACQETGGLVHGAVQWMGAYPPRDTGAGFGYTLKLGEEWKGTWNNYKVADSTFAVIGQGHWGVMVNKQQFIRFGGYPAVHRTYGGGELFVDSLWWMMGSCVVTVPDATGYHLSSGRGYAYTHDDYIHNIFNCAYALGCDDWLERAYINYLRNGRKEVLDRMMAEARVEMAGRRAKIEKERKYTFSQLLTERPWDKWNMEKHGRSNCNILVYHPTWLNLLKDSSEISKEAYRNSTYQVGLEKFIIDNLWDNVYHKDSFDKTNLPKI